jgi:hypothetical protein
VNLGTRAVRKPRRRRGCPIRFVREVGGDHPANWWGPPVGGSGLQGAGAGALRCSWAAGWAAWAAGRREGKGERGGKPAEGACPFSFSSFFS